QVRRRLLAQPLDHLAPARDEAAAGAQRLAERAGDDVDPRDHAAQLARAAPGLAERADAERVVEHDHRVVLLGEAAYAVELGDATVEREHAIGRDRAE